MAASLPPTVDARDHFLPDLIALSSFFDFPAESGENRPT